MEYVRETTRAFHRTKTNRPNRFGSFGESKVKEEQRSISSREKREKKEKEENSEGEILSRFVLYLLLFSSPLPLLSVLFCLSLLLPVRNSSFDQCAYESPCYWRWRSHLRRKVTTLSFSSLSHFFILTFVSSLSQIRSFESRCTTSHLSRLSDSSERF